MHKFLLFVFTQLHILESVDLRESDKNHLHYLAKKGKEILQKIHHTIAKV